MYSKKKKEFDSYPFFHGGDMEAHLQEVRNYEDKHRDVPCLLMAQAANGALAAELALKYLHFKEKREFFCIHDLHDLFYQLPEQHKSFLSSKICSELGQNAHTLEASLHRISTLFEHARYSFSKNETFGFSNFFTGFVHIVCDYALSFVCQENDANEDNSSVITEDE